MSGNLKKIISFALVVMMLFCVMAPLSVTAQSPMYMLTLFTEGGGHMIAGKTMYQPNEIVYVQAIPQEGYSFYCWMSNDVVIANPTVDTARFIMPAKNVSLTAVFAIKQSEEKNTVSITFDTMGGSSFNSVEIAVGETCPKPETVPTKEGYAFDGWYSDAVCTLPFDFATPINTATILYAKWTPVVTETPVLNVFSDVNESDWFYKHVMSLAEKNIISGMGKDENDVPYFAPKANITRAQFVTILANIAGGNLYKDTDIAATFDDVNNDAWYADAVAWAYNVGVSKGSGERTFSPDKNITRQDMAVMIANYAANVAKVTLPSSVEKITFADEGDIAGYAVSSVEAMQRAGIISGRSANVFAPRDFATRAETSKMIDVLLSVIE